MQLKSRGHRYLLVKDDAFAWLKRRPARSIHAVVTDPPYGILEYTATELLKRRNGVGGIWRLPQNYDGYDRMPMPRFTVLAPSDHEKIRHFHANLALLLHRVLVPGGHVLMASQNLFCHVVVTSFVAAGFELRGQIARVVQTLRGGDRPKFAHKKFRGVSVMPRVCWEPWLIFRKPCEGLVKDNLTRWQTGALRRPETGTPFTDLIRCGPARGEERALAPHPSLKPQRLMRQLVHAALPLGKGLVLDPFMGSGATIAAAESLGYRSIGIEVSDEYFRLARKVTPKLAALRENEQNGAPQRVEASRARSKTRGQKKEPSLLQ